MTNQEILTLIDEKAASDPVFKDHVDNRRDENIRQLLSEGRKKLSHTEIGTGTILAVLGDVGGDFLDSLVQIGQVNRNVYWTMDLITSGRFRIDLEASRTAMQKLAVQVPSLKPAIDELLKLGYVDDSFTLEEISNALNSRGKNGK